jgi:hypothetical protein
MLQYPVDKMARTVQIAQQVLILSWTKSRPNVAMEISSCYAAQIDPHRVVQYHATNKY